MNTARGAIVDRDSLVKVMNDGHLGGKLVVIPSTRGTVNAAVRKMFVMGPKKEADRGCHIVAHVAYDLPLLHLRCDCGVRGFVNFSCVPVCNGTLAFVQCILSA